MPSCLDQSFLLVLLLSVVLPGCVNSNPPTADPAMAPGPSPEGKAYLATEPAAGAVGVIEARKKAIDGQSIVVTGRIGGGKDPWVEGLAAFTLVDLSLPACNDTMNGRCPTPWDYCCQADLPQARLLVKVVDAAGKIVPSDARPLLGLQELQTLVVEGLAQVDQAGNVTVLARQLHVEPNSSPSLN